MINTRYQEIRFVIVLTLLLNLVVAVAKLILGYLTNTIAMVADGFHSLLDASSNIIGLVGLSLARHPPDERHPYGHGKFETIAAMSISVLMIGACYEIIQLMLGRLRHAPLPEIGVLSYVVVLGTMAVNIFVTVYESRQGRRLKSDFLLADAAHTRSDILASIAVLISIISASFHLYMVDTLAAIVIAAIIARAAFSVIKRSFAVLSDSARVDPEMVRRLVLSIPGVHLCHKVRSRGTADAIYMDLHIHLDPTISLMEAHALTHKVIATIKENMPDVADVVIHTEPAGPHHD